MRAHIPTTLLVTVALAVAPLGAHAQHGAGPPLRTTPPREARQFDFLIGQWELVAEPKVSTLAAVFHGQPKLPGTWKAWRALDGFGIEDELRLTDDAGNPRALSHAVRVYDASARRWSGSTLDVYRTRFQATTAEWKNGEMVVTSRGAGEERASVSRSRFFDIGPKGFRWEQDRSEDGGRTWNEGVLKITAKRVAAAAPR